MSDHNQIFIETKLSIAELAKELYILSGIPLVRLTYGEDPWYFSFKFVSDRVDVDLRENHFDEDDDDEYFTVSKYTFYVSAGVLYQRGVDPSTTEKWRDDFLQNLYSALKSTGRFSIALVRGLGIVMDQYDP